jgi:hypothetical protein
MSKISFMDRKYSSVRIRINEQEVPRTESRLEGLEAYEHEGLVSRWPSLVDI